jgi:hypothetical protein
MKKILTLAAVTFVMAAPSFGSVGDITEVTFHQGNALVTLSGMANYNPGAPWEVDVAANASTWNGQAGDGVITLNNAVPTGYYKVSLSANIGNWNNGTPFSVKLGGTGVTELGTTNPGEFHSYFPASNTGQDPIGWVEIASENVDSGATQAISDTFPGGVVLISDPTCSPSCSTPNMPTELGAHGTEGSPFASQVFLAPGNVVALTINENLANTSTHAKVYGLRFEEVEAIPEPASMMLLGLGATGLLLLRRRQA